MKTKQNLALNIGSDKRKCQPVSRPIGVAKLTLKRPALITKIIHDLF